MAYEALHPETRQGGVGRGGYEKDANLASFSADTAARTGRSERDVQRDATRGERIDEEVLAQISGTELDKGVVLDQLAQTPRDQQAQKVHDLTRLWEIAENLHRAELTVAERAEHIAEWIRLTGEKVAQQPAQVAPPVRKHGHSQQPSGINAAVRELGIDRSEAQRAVKIAGISAEVKAAADAAGLGTIKRAAPAG